MAPVSLPSWIAVNRILCPPHFLRLPRKTSCNLRSSAPGSDWGSCRAFKGCSAFRSGRDTPVKHTCYGPIQKTMRPLRPRSVRDWVELAIRARGVRLDAHGGRGRVGDPRARRRRRRGRTLAGSHCAQGNESGSCGQPEGNEDEADPHFRAILSGRRRAETSRLPNRPRLREGVAAAMPMPRTFVSSRRTAPPWKKWIPASAS